MAKSSNKAEKVARTNERKPQEERWAEIIDAATEIFWEKGYDAATLQDIADRVGILKGSIYYYIASKTDLRAQVLSDVHHSGISTMKQVVESEKKPLPRLYKMCFSHVLYVCENFTRTAVFLREIRRISAEEKARINVDDRAYARLFQGAILDAQEAGLIRPEIDAGLAGLCTLSSLNSVYTWYRRDSEYAPEQIARHLAHTTILGMGTPAGIKAMAKIPQA